MSGGEELVDNCTVDNGHGAHEEFVETSDGGGDGLDGLTAQSIETGTEFRVGGGVWIGGGCGGGGGGGGEGAAVKGKGRMV